MYSQEPQSGRIQQILYVLIIYSITRYQMDEIHLPGCQRQTLRRTQSDELSGAASNIPDDSIPWLDPDASALATYSGAAADQEGYDYDFCDTAESKRYECPICLLTCRNPLQTECGHRFCSYCIQKWCSGRPNGLCPVCNDPNVPLNPLHMFPDNFSKREILQLMVICVNKCHGCPITAMLAQINDHIRKCEFSMKLCPNKCGTQVPHKQLQHHLATQCPKRATRCRHCHKNIVYDQLQIHEEMECSQISESCDFCDAICVRNQMATHHLECPNYEVTCSYQPFGCTIKLPRQDIKNHNQLRIQEHTKLLADAIINLYSYLKLPTKLYDTSRAALSPWALPSCESENRRGSVGSWLQPDQWIDSGCYPTTEGTHNSNSALVYSMAPSTPQQRHKSAIFATANNTNYNMSTLGISEGGIMSERANRSYEYLASSDKKFDDASVKSFLSDPLPSTLPIDYGYPMQLYLDQQAVETCSPGTTPDSTSTVLSMNGSSFLQKKIEKLEQKVKIQQREISDLKYSNKTLEKKLNERDKQVATLEEKLDFFWFRSCQGLFIWRVKQFSVKRHEAEQGINVAIHSPGFYTSQDGYKFCIRLNPNGIEGSTGTHISVFIHLMQGENDSFLSWPFSGTITITILDQSDTIVEKKHIRDTLVAKPHIAAFQRPVTHRTHKGFGYTQFASFATIVDDYNRRYIKNDTLIVRVKVNVA